MPRGVWERRDTQQTQIIKALEDHPEGLTMEELAWEIWGDDPEGGPLTAHNQIARAFMRIKRSGRVIRRVYVID